MIGIDMIMSMLLIIPLRTRSHLITKSYYINPLKNPPQAKIQVPHLSVGLKQIFVKHLKQSKAEPGSEGHSVLFVELDCLSLSLCWCKLNRLIFLPHIKYSSQLDLPVCINVINYKGVKKRKQPVNCRPKWPNVKNERKKNSVDMKTLNN